MNQKNQIAIGSIVGVTLIVALGYFYGQTLEQKEQVNSETNEYSLPVFGEFEGDHCCGTTDGWLIYDQGDYSFKFPTEFAVQSPEDYDYLADKEQVELRVGIVNPDREELDPEMWTGLEFYYLQELPDCESGGQCNLPLQTKQVLNSLWLYDNPLWGYLYHETDGNYADAVVMYKTEIDGRPAIHYWFNNHQGMSGWPLSQNILVVQVDEDSLLVIDGFSRRVEGSQLEDFKTLETIFSTLEFK